MKKRLRLGSLVAFRSINHEYDGYARITCIVVGTWGWDGAGQRKEYYGEDPQAASDSMSGRRGYLLLPAAGVQGFRHEYFAGTNLDLISESFN